MRRLLIVGASILQLPAILKAKEMGLCVAVADFNSKAVGIPYADNFYEVSTIDEEGVYQAARDFKANGIMTLATDMPMRSVAYATSKLGLIGISYDTAVKATDKGEMIKVFEANGVEHPWYFIISSPEELKIIKDNISFPCISKPVDNAGSRGVVLIQKYDELEQAFNYSSSNGRTGKVILEEYLQGNEVSVEIMAVNGVIHILQITDKLTTGAPHFVEMGHSQPCSLGEKNISKIKDLAKRAVKAIGIENGPAHVEIMLTKDGPKMIELGARMGGDCITTHLVPLSTGIDMVKATIQIALGDPVDISQTIHRGSAIRYFSGKYGILQSISNVDQAEQIEGIRQITFVKNIGEIVGKIGSSSDRIGYVIAQADTAENAIETCNRAIKLIEIAVGS